MQNKNEAARINVAAINNVVGRVFSAGGAKVVRPQRNGYAIHAVVACTSCGTEHNLAIVKLSDFLRYPAEKLWTCSQAACPSRNAAPASETDVNKMSADQYRTSVVEPEFEKRQGVPLEIQKAYAHLYAAWSLTSPTIEATDHSQWFSREAFVTMSPQNRAAWEKWASDTMLLEGEKRRQAAANGGA